MAISREMVRRECHEDMEDTRQQAEARAATSGKTPEQRGLTTSLPNTNQNLSKRTPWCTTYHQILLHAFQLLGRNLKVKHLLIVLPPLY